MDELLPNIVILWFYNQGFCHWRLGHTDEDQVCVNISLLANWQKFKAEKLLGMDLRCYLSVA